MCDICPAVLRLLIPWFALTRQTEGNRKSVVSHLPVPHVDLLSGLVFMISVIKYLMKTT